MTKNPWCLGDIGVVVCTPRQPDKNIEEDIARKQRNERHCGLCNWYSIADDWVVCVAAKALNASSHLYGCHDGKGKQRYPWWLCVAVGAVGRRYYRIIVLFFENLRGRLLLGNYFILKCVASTRRKYPLSMILILIVIY